VKKLIDDVKARGNSLYSVVIYLAPSDYHRFHSPAAFQAVSRSHIPGYLAPVKPSYVKGHPEVFRTNERVNIFGQWHTDSLFMMTSFVGALNVGSITLHFDPELATN
jgi:phosphatidylserine decarboxylase